MGGIYVEVNYLGEVEGGCDGRAVCTDPSEVFPEIIPAVAVEVEVGAALEACRHVDGDLQLMTWMIVRIGAESGVAALRAVKDRQD